ncbi:hypothetical protein [Ramlibacter rhizophilus]|uniref:Uncharacterized protein n=1 Tax=Ramlibacter rhizophilus TaxID=1781167 RepID=A0A4Z0BEQ7_9BURK|nr:hypothetical protein [Ramlibacter rhizophilus]TFY96869.1 hypothetical protein EZ242_19540 [Ramlibacter rhizophilus]
MKIVFVIMSAVARHDTVEQLARALAPHTVLVHHDFSQSPDFSLGATNARFVPEPKRTGWAVFGFTEGVFHSLRHALDTLDFDYLQLLSPTCLPIQPMRQFEQHVSGDIEAHFDCIDLLNDRDALMSVGYRAFTPEGSLRHRVLRRLSTDYFGDSALRRDEAGIWLHSGRGRGVVPWIARAAVGAFSHPWIGRHPFGASLRPYYGSPWLGARRHIVQGLVEQFEQPEIRGYFSRLRIADEFLVATLLMRLVRRRGPMHHLIQRYNQAHVGEFGLEDLGTLRTAQAWFARKFPDDPLAPVRLHVLQELAGVAPWPAAKEVCALRPEVSASGEG